MTALHFSYRESAQKLLTKSPMPHGEVPLEHRSWERVSLHSSGSAPSNWAPHHARWCCPSEASPNAPNSCVFGTPANDLNAQLSRTHLSFDSNHYLPSTELWVSLVSGELLSLRLLDRSGRPISPWKKFEGISGQNPISVGPYLWDEKPLKYRNLYPSSPNRKFLLNSLKNLTLAVYNP